MKYLISIAIMAVALVCYRLDHLCKRDAGESDKKGTPWHWEDL